VYSPSALIAKPPRQLAYDRVNIVSIAPGTLGPRAERSPSPDRRAQRPDDRRVAAALPFEHRDCGLL
jgi:hypothetical protein